MKLKNNETGGVFVMPKSVIKYLKSAKKIESKLIMYIFANAEDSFDVQKAATALSESQDVINAALAFWRGTGIISEQEDEQKTAKNTEQKQQSNEAKEQSNAYALSISDSVKASPSYTTEDIANAIKNDTEFKHLVSYTEHTIGELLNASKTMSLLYLYDTLGMQCDVIMGVIAHCVEQGKKSIKYIEKAASGIHNDGVVTYKELESYYAQKRRFSDYETFVKRIIGASDRAFTPKEAKLVSTWANEYKTPKELVEYAYELTISGISKPSISYMGKIIETWHKDQIDSLDKAKALKEKQSTQKKEQSKSSFDGFSLEDIFEKP